MTPRTPRLLAPLLAVALLALLALLALGLEPGRQDADPTSAPLLTPAAPTSSPDAPTPHAPTPTPTFVEEWRVEDLDATTLAELGEFWHEGCPVRPEELQKVTVTHWGYDDVQHVGALVVHRDVAGMTLEAFQNLHAQRFPVQRVDYRPFTPEQNADPERWSTSMGYVCRNVRGGTTWSQHAYGTAVDVNPYQNPLVRPSGQVLGGGAQYAERDPAVKGMLVPGSAAVKAFTDAGWKWGGDWESSKDWMHFSQNGR